MHVVLPPHVPAPLHRHVHLASRASVFTVVRRPHVISPVASDVAVGEACRVAGPSAVVLGVRRLPSSINHFFLHQSPGGLPNVVCGVFAQGGILQHHT